MSLMGSTRKSKRPYSGLRTKPSKEREILAMTKFWSVYSDSLGHDLIRKVWRGDGVDTDTESCTFTKVYKCNGSEILDVSQVHNQLYMPYCWTQYSRLLAAGKGLLECMIQLKLSRLCVEGIQVSYLHVSHHAFTRAEYPPALQSNS